MKILEGVKKKFLKPKAGNERGSVTLFVLIAMLFFLTIGVIIFISTMNSSTTQHKNVNKIIEDYDNVDTVNLDKDYEEIENKGTGKLVLSIVDSFNNIYAVPSSASGQNEWINNTADGGKLPLKVDVSWPEGVPNQNKQVIIEGDIVNASGVKTHVVINADNVFKNDGGTLQSLAKNITQDCDITVEAKVNNGTQVLTSSKKRIKIDTTAPEIRISMNEGKQYINPTTRKLLQSIEITATDALSGIQKTEYIINKSVADPAENDEGWTQYTSAIDEIQNAQDGEIYYLHVKSTDNAGNVKIIKSSALEIVEARAKFLPGIDVNVKMKTFAGNEGTITYETVDELITKIEFSSTIPAEYKNDNYKVSTQDSRLPIYMWTIDDPNNSGKKIIKWFTDDLRPYMNESASNIFRGLKNTVVIADLEKIDTSKTTSMVAMFYGCNSLNDFNISNFNTSNVNNMWLMFNGCSNVELLDLSHFDTKKVTNMSSMFNGCNKLKTLNISSFNTALVTNFKCMFNGCFMLTSLDVSGFNTSSATDMGYMFDACRALISLDVSNFDTKKVTNMYAMFYDCRNIEILDLRNFDTPLLSNTGRMFDHCSKLKILYATDKFDVSKVTESANMFANSTKLIGGAGTAYDVNHLDKAYACIDGKGASGYFTNHYFIKFDSNIENTTGNMTNQGIPFSYATNLRANTFIKDGYTFIGWNTKADGTGTNFVNEASMNYDLAGIKALVENEQDKADDKNVTLTLYAKWMENNYENLTTHKMYDTLTSALAEAQNGETVEVKNSKTEADTPVVAAGKAVILNIPEGKTTTLNQTLTVQASGTNLGQITFTGNGAIINQNCDMITNKGKVIVDGPTLNSVDRVINGEGYSGNIVEVRSGKLNVTGAKVRTTNYTAIWADNITMIDGEIINDYKHYGIIGCNSINITGGKIKSKGTGIHNGNINGVLNISGDAEITGESIGIVSYSRNCNISIAGGTIIGGNSGIYIYANSNTIDIKSGTIIGATYGIYSRPESSGHTITIGDNTTALDKTKPIIQGTNRYSIDLEGITSTLNYYDGTLIGARHDKTYDGREVTFSIANDTTVNPLSGYKPYTRQNTETNKYETVLEKEVTITADANNGTISVTDGWTIAQDGKTATKKVLQNTTYGVLPPQNNMTKEGYTFTNWTGKNLLNLKDRTVQNFGDYYNTTVRKFTGNGIYVGATANNYYRQSYVSNYEIDNTNNNVIVTSSAGGYGVGFDLRVKPSTSYTISKGTSSQVAIRVGEYTADGTFIKFTVKSEPNVIINTTENTKWILIVVAPDVASQFNTSVTNYNIQIEEGATATAYESYQVIDANTVVTAGEDHKIYANWDLNVYNITYNLDGGTNNAQNLLIYTVESPDITLQDPTKEGYIFRGWTGNGTTTPTKNLVLPHGSTEDKTYTANWSQAHYNVTYGSPAITKPAETLAEAMSLAQDNATIKVTLGFEDTSVTDANNAAQGVLVNKNVTIDTNGKELIMANTITVAANKTVTFVDTAETKGKLQRTNGRLIMGQGTVKVGTNSTNGANMDSTDRVINARNVVVNSGILNLTGKSELTTNFGVIFATNITINGGELINNYQHYGIYGSNTINITGGIIRGKDWGINNGNSNTTLNISGEAQIIGDSTGITSYATNSNITITGGTITGGDYAIYIYANSCTMNIKDGTIIGGGRGISTRAESSGHIITIGDNSTGLDKTKPIIQGTNGYSIILEGSTTFNYYDGKLIGAYNNKTFDGRNVTFGVANDTTVNPLSGYKPFTRLNSTTNKYETVLEKEVTVTADANDGTISATDGWTIAQDGKTATKTVLQNTPYGTLPTQDKMTRIGYTFNGWKNTIFKESDFVNSLVWEPNQNVNVTKTNDYVQVIYNQNNSTPGYIYKSADSFFEVGKKYTVTAYVKGIGTTDLSVTLFGTGTSQNINLNVSTDDFTKVSGTFTYSKKYQNFILLYKQNPTIGTGFQIKWLQIQEGDVATDYDITNETIVKTPLDHKLMADWTANQYTVSFDPNGGSVTPAFKPVTFDSAYGTLPIPTREGYTFGGWFTGENGTGTQIQDTTKVQITDNQTLYAKWTINQYQVTCEDWFVDSSNVKRLKLGTQQEIKTYDYGSKVSGADWGTDKRTAPNSGAGYYACYDYQSASEITLGASNATVYRYFYAWTNINVNNPEGQEKGGTVAKFSVSYNGGSNWLNNQSDQRNDTYIPYGTKILIKDITMQQPYYELDEVTTATYDSTNSRYEYEVKSGGNTINIKTKYKIFAITLDNQSATSAGTTTIYEKYNTGYYTDSNATTMMSTTQNKITVPTRAGYDFGGYYTEINGGGTQYIDVNGKLTSSASITNFSTDGSLYAKWTARTDTPYKVKHYKQNIDGTYPSTPADTDNLTGTTDTKVTPARKTYTGFTQPSGTEVTIKGDGTTEVIYQYTRDSHAVTYNYSQNGGTSATKTTDTKKYEDAIDLTATATKSGYDFVGWNTNKDAHTALASLNMETGNVTLYAIFKKDIKVTTYQYNNSKVEKTGTLYNKDATVGIELPTIANKTVGDVEYTQRGWSTSNTADATIVANSGATVQLSDNTTYYASYQKDFEATFNYWNGTAKASKKETKTRFMDYNGAFKQTNYDIPNEAKTNVGDYTYKHISTGTGTNSAAVTPTTANTTYYTVYTRTLTVEYDGNGGRGTTVSQTATQTMNANGAVTSHNFTLQANSFNRNGYTFTKWALESVSGTQYVAGATYAFAPAQGASKDVKFYALWTEKTYTLTIKPNGGTLDDSTTDITRNLKYSDVSNINNPTRTGYTFSGWNELSGAVFADGLTSVSKYSNQNNSQISITSQAKSADNPIIGTTNELKITNAGTAATKPGLGGFYKTKIVTANSKYVHVFVAKLPAGYYFHNANNSLGTGATTEWLTSNEGTGKWQTYIYKVNAGTGGTLRDFGHVYVSKDKDNVWSVGTAETGAYTAYLAYNNIFDITDNDTGIGQIDGTGVLTANWTVNQYTVTCEDWFVDASNNRKVKIATQTASKDYGTTVKGSDWGTAVVSGVSTSYRYHGETSSTVPANDNLVVYRYFYVWVDVNIYNPAGTQDYKSAYFSLSKDNTNWYTDLVNENTNGCTITNNLPWGSILYIKDLNPYYNYYEYDRCTGCTYDSTNNKWTYTVTGPNSMCIYMKYKIFTVSLDNQNATSTNHTTVIYEKYNTGYYTDSSATTQMTTSANGITVPTKTGYTFGGYYTETNGGGTQYIDANGKLTSSASTTNFSSNGTLYAKWTANTYTVTYNGNGNTGGSTASSSHTYDTAKALTANGYTKTGYSFAGWNTKADGTGTSYADKASVSNLTATNNGTVTLYAQWTVNQYTVTYKDVFVDSSNVAHGDPLGTTTKQKDYGSTVNANEIGTDTALSKYYNRYQYKGTSGDATVPANNDLVVYRYFWAWNNINVKNPEGTEKMDGSVAKFSVSYNGASYIENQSNETQASIILPYGATIRIKDIAMQQPYYLLDKVTWGGTTLTATDGVYTAIVTTANTILEIKTKYISNTISFNNNGGNGGQSDDVTATYNSAMPGISTTAPTKTGYTFGGWYDTSASTGGTQYYTAVGASARTWNKTTNATLYARWTANTYKVVFNKNADSATGTMADQNFTYDVAQNLTQNGFSRTGYSFAGWNTKADGTGISYADKVSVSNLTATNNGTVTLYAQWTVNQYTVTCEDWFVDASNGHKVKLATQTASKDYGTTVKGSDWGTAVVSGVSTAYKYQSDTQETVPANDNLVVYRYFWLWTDINIFYANRSTQGGATVSFSNDGTNWVDRKNETAAEVTKPWGTTYYIKNIRPVNATEEFDSVVNLTYDSANGYYKTTPTAAGQAMTIYMKYKTFTVSLDNQSATSAGTTAIYEKYNTGYYTDSSATTQMTTSANGITVPTKTGYTFGGYYTETNGGGTQYIDVNGKLTSSASTTNFSSNGTLYAKWTANTYTVTYNGNGNTGGSTAQSTHTYDVAKNLTANGFTRAYTVTYNYDGATGGNGTANATATYTFNKWNTAANGSGTNYTNSQSVTNLATSGNFNLYAQWNSASVTLPTPTKPGYTFGGWYKEAALTNLAGAGGASFTPTAAITLYAKWTVNTYTVTYNGNGNTGGSTVQSTHTYDVAKNLTANGFTRAHTVTYNYNGATGGNGTANAIATYTFNKWNTEANGSGTDYTNGQSVINLATSGNFNLYAQWNSASVILPTPTKTGYTFGGWYKEAALTNLAGAGGASFTPTATITLYAKLTANTYQVAFDANGGNGTMANQTGFRYGTSTALNTNTFTRDGCIFKGWATSQARASEGIVDYADRANMTTGTATNGGTVTLYAVWEGVFAKLYEDGTLILSSRDYTDTNRGEFLDYGSISNYTGEVLPIANTVGTLPPWYESSSFIGNVIIKDEIKPTSTCAWFYDCTNLTTITGIENLNTSNVTNMNGMFYNCDELTSLNISSFDTSKVTGMNYMFKGCSGLTSLNISNFDTSKVTGMSYMFAACSGLTGLNISNFDTSKVTNMKSMFNSCENLVSITGINNIVTSNVTNMSLMFHRCNTLASLDVSHFDTVKVTDMSNMFEECNTLTQLDVSGFNTSRVTNMSRMFEECNNVIQLNVSGFNTSNVTDLSGMFIDCSTLTSLDVSNFDTSNVTDLSGMFSGCSNVTQLNVSGFNTSNATNISGMFGECSSLIQLDVSNFNTSNVTDMQGTFYGCSGLTQLDVSNFDTSNVTRMAVMFEGCSGLTSLDLSHFDTSNVDYISSMFEDCTNLTTIYTTSNFDISGVDDSLASSIFRNCINLVGGNGTSYDSSHIDKTYARIDQDGTPGYFTSLSIYAKTYTDGTLILSSTDYTDANRTVSNDYGNIINYVNEIMPGISPPAWYTDVSNIKNVIIKDKIIPNTTFGWFAGCRQLTEIIGINNLDTSNVTDMSFMFNNCSNLTSLDVSKFNTSNVTNMLGMFSDCVNLTSLDVSKFDTANVTNMNQMFYRCFELTSLDVSKFNTLNVTAMGDMFRGCGKLTSLDVSKFNTSNVTNMSGMFDGCSKLTSLDVSKFNTSNVTTMGGMFESCSGLTSLDVSKFNTSNVTNMSRMFDGCKNLTSLDVSKFNTSNVTCMSSMFFDCNNVANLDVSQFNTSNVTEMDHMFLRCNGLTSLNLSNFNTSNVTTMYSMFLGCNNITILDLSSFNFEKVQSISFMFEDCTSLTTIYVNENYSLKWGTYGEAMFIGCVNIVGGNGTTYDDSMYPNGGNYDIDSDYARIDREGEPGYFSVLQANYTTSLNGVTLDKWKIFYKDGNYTYIILDDYLPNSAVSNTIKTNYNLANGNGDYTIKSTTNRKDLIDAMTTTSNWSSLLTGTLNGTAIDYRSSADTNIKANRKSNIRIICK